MKLFKSLFIDWIIQSRWKVKILLLIYSNVHPRGRRLYGWTSLRVLIIKRGRKRRRTKFGRTFDWKRASRPVRPEFFFFLRDESKFLFVGRIRFFHASLLTRLPSSKCFFVSVPCFLEASSFAHLCWCVLDVTE